MIMNYNNIFTKAIERQCILAKKAIFSLNSKILNLNLPIDLQIDLYSKLVIPILTYGCEVWGFENTNAIELLHRSFIKNILRVNKYVSNSIIYGETGTTKIEVEIYTRMIGYWHRLRSGPNTKISKILFTFIKKLSDNNIYRGRWVSKVRDILDKTGSSYLWNFERISSGKLKSNIKQKLYDAFLQNWQSDINTNILCSNYRIMKVNFGQEFYLKEMPKDLRIILTKFRTGNHNLPISDQRYNQIDERNTCPLCYTDVGDEYHYVMNCPAFDHIRAKYISSTFITPANTLTFHKLFSTKSIPNLTKLCKFLKIIMHVFK